jgi:hypothetical protein
MSVLGRRGATQFCGQLGARRDISDSHIRLLEDCLWVIGKTVFSIIFIVNWSIDVRSVVFPFYQILTDTQKCVYQFCGRGGSG